MRTTPSARRRVSRPASRRASRPRTPRAAAGWRLAVAASAGDAARCAVAALRSWRGGGSGAYRVADAALERCARRGAAAALRGGGFAEGADEPHDDVPPATLRGCCAAAAASCGDAAAAAALALRSAATTRPSSAAVAAASVAADVDVYDLRRGLVRVGGGAAPTDADEAAVQFRAARKHAATARLEARAAALEACRAKKRATGAFDVVSARRWKALDAAAARARRALRAPARGRKLWDDRSVVAALELAAGARAARADLSADDVEAATDARRGDGRGRGRRRRSPATTSTTTTAASSASSGARRGRRRRPALGGLSIADLPTPPTKPPRRAEPAS
ncbi:hypothetical protein JL722_326 [Aureococcus anophagefferens]|nr:hypothetical protein JL722_326 [Aureococcus anophagefferens]